uniref:protein kinase C n=1 Tax=Scleropages formosus TaxID=113540 RepID=A0A8C9STW6_SCLFO
RYPAKRHTLLSSHIPVPCVFHGRHGHRFDPSVSYEKLQVQVRDMCSMDDEQLFTMPCVPLPSAGNPCTVTSHLELDEALHPCELGKDSELIVHGERPRDAGRSWTKLYCTNGHTCQAKRFNRRARCAICADRIWGLGRQDYKCVNCKLLVHNRRHKLVTVDCGRHVVREPLTGLLDPASMSSDHPEAGICWVRVCVCVCVCVCVREREREYTVESRKMSTTLGLANFDLLRLIGRGSYAKVLLVKLKRTERIYAMKVVKKELANDGEDIDWVQTEKHVFEQASNHPFLVRLHSCFQTESRLFFVIEYVNGRDLMFHMQRQRKLPEEHARFYAAEISLALDYLHERGIICQILKLDNVLLESEGPIKLTDYGMCKVCVCVHMYDGVSLCHPQTGFADIMGHPFFCSVDWDLVRLIITQMMEQKQVVPPFKPSISGEFGLDNFDSQFTNEPIQLTPDDDDMIRKIDQSEFKGFEYINPP